jgi:hypothetical protein
MPSLAALMSFARVGAYREVGLGSLPFAANVIGNAQHAPFVLVRDDIAEFLRDKFARVKGHRRIC